ncbi:MAG: 50S ribosomal protein L19 [Candidatus Omnitrophica bacterium]|nr:50S ribosomal protein L19 [Candidatus Omnitrophota bacterium]MBU4149452.1 50S ribosomal protein L19 [Candidatus Omnitrophota bacterium]
MDKIKEIEKRFMKKEIPQFNVGDTVKVSVRIKEGEKTRLQGFEGIVIGKKGSSIKETFAVRRVSYGEGIERVFQLHSPTVDSVSVIKKGKVNKAKLYYLRGRVGKHTKVEEKREAEKTTNAPVGEKGLS